MEVPKRLLQTTTTTYGPDSVEKVGAIIGMEILTAPPQESSVEITTDAKGMAKPTVKVYHTDPEEALRQALALYRQARQALGV